MNNAYTDALKALEQFKEVPHVAVVVNIDDLHDLLRSFVKQGYVIRRERKLAIWHAYYKGAHVFRVLVDTTRTITRGVYLTIPETALKLPKPELHLDVDVPAHDSFLEWQFRWGYRR